MGHLYIAGTIFFTVYGQLILKWRMSSFGVLPETVQGKFLFFTHVLFDPFIVSGLLSAFVASIFWMAAMTKFDLSYAYPFMSIPFVIVLFLSAFFFHEPVTFSKVAGMTLIVAGIAIGAYN